LRSAAPIRRAGTCFCDGRSTGRTSENPLEILGKCVWPLVALGVSDKFIAYVNTTDIVALANNRVAVILKLKDKHPAADTKGDDAYVEVYGCDAKDVVLSPDRVLALSQFSIDGSGKLVGEVSTEDPFGVSVKTIPPGSFVELLHDAACWLRKTAKERHRLPAQFDSHVSVPSDLDPWR
jgi:hypothetical protein